MPHARVDKGFGRKMLPKEGVALSAVHSIAKICSEQSEKATREGARGKRGTLEVALHIEFERLRVPAAFEGEDTGH
jgi:hypothetical protein